jgi:hypothetical protein
MRKSTEMLVNMKSEDIPVWDPKKNYYDQHRLTLQFWQNEAVKIRKGLKIGVWKMSPWLYFHLNIFKTPVPRPTKEGGVSDKIMNPPFTDNDLLVADSLADAQRLNRTLALFGTRGFFKSTYIASYTQHTVLNTQGGGTFKIIGGSDGDLKDIAKMLQTTFENVTPAFYLPTLKKDWEDHVIFGVKDKSTSGKSYVHAHIVTINADDTKKKSDEKGAGGSPIGLVIDEALHEDCILYYEKGEKPIKDAKIGDYIYGADGKLTKILDKINPGVVDLFRVELSDGREVLASANHVWKTYNTVKEEWQEVTTEVIASKYFYEKYDKRYDKFVKSLIYSIPINKNINYPKKDLKIDPYWLGLYLGDGFTGKPVVCSIDKEIVDYCIRYSEALDMSYSIYKLSKNRLPNFDIIRIKNKKRSNKANKLKDLLKHYNIDQTKTIPEDYLKSNEEDRLQLLKGIMDTDGSICKRGHVEFSTVIKEFADSFEFLCRSLGLSVKRTLKRTNSYQNKSGVKVICKDVHRFSINTSINIFTLKRKREALETLLSKKNTKTFYSVRERVTIKSVTKEEKGQAYCIKVDNSDNLFITQNFIVTHNCGKFDFTKVFNSALPSFRTPYGYRFVPILSGTSGSMELAKPARAVLENPEAWEVLPFNYKRLCKGVPEEAITWSGDINKKFGTFVPGQMSGRHGVPKVKKKLSDFLGLKNEHLDQISINVTNWTKATEEIKRLHRVGDSSGKEDDKKNQMYYPLEIDDIFQTVGKNPFPAPQISRRIKYLENEGVEGKPVELFKENGKISFNYSTKDRAKIEHTGGACDAPAFLYGSLPETPPEKFFFIGGLDDYKTEISYTDSLGSFYILQRRNLALNTPCEKIVLSYTARPNKHREFHDQCQLGLEAFSAECLMEVADTTFIEHLEKQNLAGRYLTPSLTFAPSSDKGTGRPLANSYGLYPTKYNNSFRMKKFIDWCWEEHTVGIDENGNPITKYSVEFLDDVELLKEMLLYKPGKNVDRIVAFSHALLRCILLDEANIFPKQLSKQSMFSSKPIDERPRVKRNNNPYGIQTRGKRGWF